MTLPIHAFSKTENEQGNLLNHLMNTHIVDQSGRLKKSSNPLPLDEIQKELIEDLLDSYVKVNLSTETSNILKSFKLRELLDYLRTEHTLNNIEIIGGFPRQVLLSSYDSITQFLKQLGVEEAAHYVTHELLEERERALPDYDFRFWLADSSRYKIAGMTTSIVRFLGQQLNLSNSTWIKKHVFSKFYLSRPMDINQYSVAAFGQIQQSTLETLFVHRLSRQHLFYHDACSIRLGHSTFDLVDHKAQILVDLLTRTIHLNDLSSIDHTGFIRLMSCFIRGYILMDKEVDGKMVISTLLQRAPDHLINLIMKHVMNHHYGDPLATIALAYQASCYLSTNAVDALWRQLSLPLDHLPDSPLKIIATGMIRGMSFASSKLCFLLAGVIRLALPNGGENPVCLFYRQATEELQYRIGPYYLLFSPKEIVKTLEIVEKENHSHIHHVLFLELFTELTSVNDDSVLEFHEEITLKHVEVFAERYFIHRSPLFQFIGFFLYFILYRGEIEQYLIKLPDLLYAISDQQLRQKVHRLIATSCELTFDPTCLESDKNNFRMHLITTLAHKQNKKSRTLAFHIWKENASNYPCSEQLAFSWKLLFWILPECVRESQQLLSNLQQCNEGDEVKAITTILSIYRDKTNTVELLPNVPELVDIICSYLARQENFQHRLFEKNLMWFLEKLLEYDQWKKVLTILGHISKKPEKTISIWRKLIEYLKGSEVEQEIWSVFEKKFILQRDLTVEKENLEDFKKCYLLALDHSLNTEQLIDKIYTLHQISNEKLDLTIVTLLAKSPLPEHFLEACCAYLSLKDENLVRLIFENGSQFTNYPQITKQLLLILNTFKNKNIPSFIDLLANYSNPMIFSSLDPLIDLSLPYPENFASILKKTVVALIQSNHKDKLKIAKKILIKKSLDECFGKAVHSRLWGKYFQIKQSLEQLDELKLLLNNFILIQNHRQTVIYWTHRALLSIANKHWMTDDDSSFYASITKVFTLHHLSIKYVNTAIPILTFSEGVSTKSMNFSFQLLTRFLRQLLQLKPQRQSAIQLTHQFVLHNLSELMTAFPEKQSELVELIEKLVFFVEPQNTAFYRQHEKECGNLVFIAMIRRFFDAHGGVLIQCMGMLKNTICIPKGFIYKKYVDDYVDLFDRILSFSSPEAHFKATNLISETQSSFLEGEYERYFKCFMKMIRKIPEYPLVINEEGWAYFEKIRQALMKNEHFYLLDGSIRSFEVVRKLCEELFMQVYAIYHSEKKLDYPTTCGPFDIVDWLAKFLYLSRKDGAFNGHIGHQIYYRLVETLLPDHVIELTKLESLEKQSLFAELFVNVSIGTKDIKTRIGIRHLGSVDLSRPMVIKRCQLICHFIADLAKIGLNELATKIRDDLINRNEHFPRKYEKKMLKKSI